MDYGEMYVRVKELLEAGGFLDDEAVDSIELIAQGREWSQIPDYELCSYSWALADNREWARAEAIAYLIKDDEDDEGDRGQALAILAQRLASRGLFDEASRIVYSIHRASLEKIVAFTYIAKGLSKIGDVEQTGKVLIDAEEALGEYSPASPLLAHLWCDVAEIWKQIGKREEALRTWDKAVAIAYEAYRWDVARQSPTADSGKALFGIVMSIAEGGEIGYAKEMVKKHLEEEQQEYLLWRISEIEKTPAKEN